MWTRQGQERVNLVQERSHFRVAQSGPYDNVPKGMTNEAVNVKENVLDC